MLIKNIFIFLLTFACIGVILGAKKAEAAITYGNGSYVNLCGSGTAANLYSCSNGCNPSTGQCQSNNNGVVKYVCSGRWDQCFEAEGYFSNSESIGDVACGNTVQLSLFDKACRKDDGSWDTSCKLQGYMVWYSGDCAGTVTTPSRLSIVPTRSVTATPTRIPSVTGIIRSTATLTPSPTSKLNVSPTVSARACGVSCTEAVGCGAGLTCVSGQCRNPSCPSDKSCFCGKAGGKTTPETGGEMWLVGGIVAMAGSSWAVRRFAKKLW